MTSGSTRSSASSTRLRLWPGASLAIVVVLAAYVAPAIAPDATILSVPLALIGVFAGIGGGVAIALWWLFFSRAPWPERLATIAGMIAAILVTRQIVHASIAGGMMGMMLVIYAVPPLGLAIVAAAAMTRGRSDRARRAALAAAIALACVPFVLLRTEGITGDGRSQLQWRWTPTAEELLLAQSPSGVLSPSPAPAVAQPAASERLAAPSSVDDRQRRPDAASAAPSGDAPGNGAPAASKTDNRPATASTSDNHAAVAAPPARGDNASGGDPAASGGEWPGFRGRDRDSVVRGVQIATDWAASPPVELWRKPIGPGWSSFAVNGGLIYTQEQRGDYELVSAYRLSTGEPVWQHRDAVRFWESNGGAGPRATPTISNGSVYTLGATGILNALDAQTGRLRWSRNVSTDTGVEVPGWGFAGSPLVVDDVVVVAVSGQLVGYDAASGAERWMGPSGGAGYSSPHLVTVDGVPQIVLLRGSRTIAVAPRDGTLLWDHTAEPGVSIVQPALAGSDELLIASGDAMAGLGLRRVAIARGAGGWSVQERWTSRGLKPYFNDFVVHDGYAYGFDGSILAAVDLADGTRKWKGGRYGHGQLMLLADQDLLVVLAEDGELVLVSATPERHAEIARFRVLDDKTWNHPVIVGDTLLVRNGEEMAAFRLAGRQVSR